MRSLPGNTLDIPDGIVRIGSSTGRIGSSGLRTGRIGSSCLRITALWCLILVALAVRPDLAAGAREALVPIDSEGRLERIDPALERRVGLFPEVRGFREARIFQLEDSTFVLEVSYGSPRLMRVRTPLSPAEAGQFRQKVTDALRISAPSASRERSGRMRLLVTSTALSAGYYGWAVPVILDARDEKAVGLYMLVAGAGIVGPVLLTQAHGVSDAEATLAGYGGTRGIAHGIFAYRGSADIRTSDGYAGAGMIGSIAEGAAGFWAARRFRLSTGRVEAIAAGGDFGFGLGAGIDDLARFDDDGALAASVLLGSALGMGSGALLSADGRYTRGDAWLLRASGSGGAIIGAALATVGRDHFDRTQTGFALAGGAAGIVLGHSLAKSRDLTAGEGLLMNLGTIGGGLLGLGVAYVIAHDSEVLLPLGAAAGTGAGFWSAGVLVGEGSAGKSAAAEPGSHRLGASIGNGPRLALSVFPRLSSGPARSSGRVTGVGVRLRTGF